MDPTLADIVKKRIELRDEIVRMKKLHADELRPAYAATEILDQMMLDYFSREGCKHCATHSGTAYRKISHSVRMLDREAFKDWVIDGRWNQADIKPNKRAMVNFVDDHKRPPPGVEIDGRFTVGYRKVGEPEEGEEIEY